MNITIDGIEYIVSNVDTKFGLLPTITTTTGEQFALTVDREEASEKVRTHYEDMAKNQPTEFLHYMGHEEAVKMIRGYGLSFEEWLNDTAANPEQFFNPIDGRELDVEEISEALVATLGFKPTLAYQTQE